MRRILLPFGSDSADDAPVTAAAALARRHGSRITAMFCPRLPDPVIVDPMSGGVVSYDGLDGELETHRDAAVARIRERIAACDPPMAADAVNVDMSAISNWRQVGEAARVHDVSLYTRSKDNPHWQTLFEMALFEGGRPTILIPEQWERPFGDVVGIAWNHSTETARVVALAMPILRAASRVVVITVEGWVHAGPGGDALVDYLASHDIEVQLKAGAGGGNPGARSLDIAAEAGVDFLVKGAYTQSRLTQMIFGGATRIILDQAQIPVVFAH